MNTPMTTEDRIQVLSDQLALLQESVDLLLEQNAKRTELIDEVRPVATAVMDESVRRLAEWEERGLFRLGRAGMRVVGRVVESTTEEDLDALGESVVSIVDTIKTLTQPEVLALVQEGAEVIDEAEKAAPVGVIGLARATTDVNVQKGLGLLVATLRHVGRASRVLGKKAKKLKEPRPVERAPAAPSAAPAAPAGGVSVAAVGGVRFTSEGFMEDSSAWSRDLAVALAVDAGVSELSERHWEAIEAARKLYEESGESPNIRRLTNASDITVKELYSLFPRAPGKTVALIAGIPKPVGCL
jgi:TusE/DsrC/DsvC family sulfur relay protein